MLFNSFCCLASMAGAVIQATGRTELEDGLCAGGQLKARNGLQRVGTILWINRIPPRGRCETQTSQGQTQFESAEARGAAGLQVQIKLTYILSVNFSPAVF